MEGKAIYPIHYVDSATYTMPPKKSTTLTEAELRLMKILWRRGESAVHDLVAAMPDGESLAYNSVLTTIRILEQKGYVTHIVSSGTFVYRATESAESAAAAAVKGIVDRFCGGSIERVLAGLVDAALLDPNQLAAIAGKLKRKPK